MSLNKETTGTISAQRNTATIYHQMLDWCQCSIDSVGIFTEIPDACVTLFP